MPVPNVKPPVVLDTNVFVAAGFDPDGRAADILSFIRRGEMRLVWNEATRRETKHILRKIPPLDDEAFDDLFDEEHRFEAANDVADYTYILDPDDRKFAALADASGATLVTLDRDLLSVRRAGQDRIVTPSELVRTVERKAP